MIGWGIALIISVAGIFVILLRRLPEAVRATQAGEVRAAPSFASQESVRKDVDSSASTVQSSEAVVMTKQTKRDEAAPVKRGLTQRLMDARVFRKTSQARRVQAVQKIDEMSFDELSLHAEQLFKKKDYQKAIDAYQRLILEQPREPRWYNRIGAVYLELEQFHDARDAFRAALKHGGDSAGRYANLAMAEYALGHRLTAMKHMKRAIALAPESDHYEELLRVIESDTGA